MKSRLLIVLLALYALNVLYVESSIALGHIPSGLFFGLSSLLPFSIAVVHAGLRLGWQRMLLMLGLSFTVSLLFESLGVAYGWVYGPYLYTSDHLGPKLFGLVPLLIPVGWFMMSYPSFVVSDWLVPVKMGWVRRALAVAAIAGLVMTAWDVVVDPVRVAVGQWQWEVEGVYFGIPLKNYWGWWLTTFVTILIFLLLSRYKPPAIRAPRFDKLAVVSYALTGLGEISGAYFIGQGGPALAGFFAMAPWVIASWLRMTDGETRA